MKSPLSALTLKSARCLNYKYIHFLCQWFFLSFFSAKEPYVPTNWYFLMIEKKQEKIA
jgi:hypothetical protein